MRATLKCHKCQLFFPSGIMVKYASPTSVNEYYYCPDCLKEKQEEDDFRQEIAAIFGHYPAGKCNTQRKHIRAKYGYTNSTILDCLHYIYEVEKWPIPEEPTLGVVTPTNIEKTMKYKRLQASKGSLFAQAQNETIIKKIVPIRENKKDNKTYLNPDDFLDD